MLNKTKLLLVSSIVLLASIGLANASDKKDFPGSTCQVEYDYNYSGAVASSWMYYGGAYENTTQPVDGSDGHDHVNCPIVRTTTNNTNGVSVKVRVYNPGADGALWCELFSAGSFVGGDQQTGFPYASPEEIVHVNAAPGLSEINISTATSFPGGIYSLHCEVPATGLIYSYESKEFSHSDD